MADEPSWDDLFSSQPGAGTPVSQGTREPARSARDERLVPLQHDLAPTRRELRAQRSAPPPRPADEEKPPRKRRRLGWLWGLVSALLVLGVGAAAVFVVFEQPIRELFTADEPVDYEGSGTGEVTVTITAGDIGEDIARSLLEAGVTRTFGAFYSLLLENPDVSFQPGSYALREKMSAQSALDALLDPANKRELTVLVQEGRSVQQVLELVSAGTEIPLEQLTAAASAPQSFGLPPEAASMEGYLFPATYTFEPGLDAATVLQQMVDRSFQSLDAAGVAPADRYRVLTIAALIQREAGSNPDDFYKVSRVIQNRLDDGMMLQFDSTAHYGYAVKYGERLDQSVFSTEEELTDDNPYNTYVITGLPQGPIAAPGDLAIKAAMAPVDGPWLYFVTVNLDTGETTFSATLDEHNAAVRQLQNWCRESQSENCA